MSKALLRPGQLVRPGQLWLFKLQGVTPARLELVSRIHSGSRYRLEWADSIVIWSSIDEEIGEEICDLPAIAEAWINGGFELISDV